MGFPALPTRVEKRAIRSQTLMLLVRHSQTATGDLRSVAEGKAPPSTLGEQGRVSHKTIVQIKAEPAWPPSPQTFTATFPCTPEARSWP